MSVCPSPNVVSIPIVHRYILTNAVNQFGKRERDRFRTDWFVHSCAMEVTSHLRHRFAHRLLWCCTNAERYKVYSDIYPTRCNVTQLILSGNCSTCFGWYLHPKSGAHSTVSTASGICHTVSATCRYSGR